MPSSTNTCADCQREVYTVEVRRRRLCNECFQKYISSKILKRMETYRFKNQVGGNRKRLLLPMSGGTASFVLLQVLDQQVRRQFSQQGRTAYELVICHVEDDLEVKDLHDSRTANSRTNSALTEWWTAIAAEFNMHTQLPIKSFRRDFPYDDQIVDDLCLLYAPGSDLGHSDILDQLMRTTKTATARSDLKEILLNRLIVSIAKQNSCTSVIWGHCDSKLAAKALADVAKGRGSAVPNGIADGRSPWGLEFNYPLRDLFMTELEMYVKSLPTKTQECHKQFEPQESAQPVALRLTSIDALLNTYITDQGEKYPSIMANVVRTASRLQVPNVTEGSRCKLCAMPSDQERQLCYGCERMKQDIKG